MMKIVIETNRLPEGVWGMAPFWPLILVRPDKANEPWLINHEEIHLAQHVDFLIIQAVVLAGLIMADVLSPWCAFAAAGPFLFLLIYIANVLFHRFAGPVKWNHADHRTMFEREADAHDKDPEYLSSRRRFAFLRYLRNG